MICRKTNGVADATYGGYHISYEVKKLMYEIPKSCSLVCPCANQSMFYIIYVKPHITIFRCCFVLITYFLRSSYNNHILTFSTKNNRNKRDFISIFKK